MLPRSRRARPRRWRGGRALLECRTSSKSRSACYAFFFSNRTGVREEPKSCLARLFAVAAEPPSLAMCLTDSRGELCGGRDSRIMRGRIASRHTSTETDAVLNHIDGYRGLGTGRGSAGGRPRGAAVGAAKRRKLCLSSSSFAPPRRHTQQLREGFWKEPSGSDSATL